MNTEKGTIIQFPTSNHETNTQGYEGSSASIVDFNERRSAHLFETPKLQERVNLMSKLFNADVRVLREADTKKVERYLLQFPSGTPFELDGESVFPFLQIWVPNRAISFRKNNLYVVMEDVSEFAVGRVEGEDVMVMRGMQKTSHTDLIIKNNPFTAQAVSYPQSREFLSNFEKEAILKNGRTRFDRIAQNNKEEGLLF